MSVVKQSTGRFRHVPRVIKYWFSKNEIVFVLQEEFTLKGEHYSNDPADDCPLHVDKTIWEDCKNTVVFDKIE